MVAELESVGASSSAVRSAAVRALALIPTAVATLAATRIVISHFGLEAFDAYAVIVSALALLPLNNLGVGAAVTNAYAVDPNDSERVTLTSARALAGSTVVTTLLALVIAALGAWPALLGSASGSNVVCGLAIVVWSFSFVPGLGQNVLLGVHRNHVAVAIQALSAPILLVTVALAATLNAPSGWVVVAPSVAILAVNLMMAIAGARAGAFSWRTVLGRLPSPRRWPGQSVRAIAVPLLVTSISVPIALQSDRIVLSHVSSTQAVAEYSIVLQLFAPLIALIGAAAQPLWPIYAAARARGTRGPSLTRILMLFVGSTVVVCAGVVLVADPLGRFVGDGAVHLGVLLPVAAALSTIAQAATFPIAMTLMHPRGARFIAITTTLSLPVNLFASILLAQRIGAPGPLFATAGAGVIFGVVAPLFVHRRLNAPDRVPRHLAGE